MISKITSPETAEDAVSILHRDRVKTLKVNARRLCAR
jgi:hypothetical protein